MQLRKRLYGQAVDNLKRALKLAEANQEPSEAQALIQNALGFGLAAQDNYKAALKHYRAALAAKADYPVALNNLAYALEKQSKPEEAREAYRSVLALDAGNKTARKRLQRLSASWGWAQRPDIPQPCAESPQAAHRRGAGVGDRRGPPPRQRPADPAAPLVGEAWRLPSRQLQALEAREGTAQLQAGHLFAIAQDQQIELVRLRIDVALHRGGHPRWSTHRAGRASAPGA